MKIFLKIIFLINWKKKIFPTIVKNKNNLLMLAWTNKNSLIETFYFKKTCFWSRSKKKYWRKGQESNFIQILIKIFFDCDLDAIVFYINQFFFACHYKKINCFFFKI